MQGISTDELNRIDNLVLLCLAHHKVVDKLRPKDFPTPLLQEWKAARESASYSELRGLRELTEEQLQDLVTDAFESLKERVESAVSKLETIDRDLAKLLRPMVNDFAEANLLGRFPDQDSATVLANAAAKLEHLKETAGQLERAADKLAGLRDVATLLNDVADRIERSREFM
jgi:uncharacterized protein involved in exopolysaccharide biosynthesis